MHSCVSVVFRLFFLCHKPNLLFRFVFEGQQLIERFKNKSKLSIRIRSEFLDFFVEFGIIKYYLPHLCEGPHNLDIYMDSGFAAQDTGEA